MKVNGLKSHCVLLVYVKREREGESVRALERFSLRRVYACVCACTMCVCV